MKYLILICTVSLLFACSEKSGKSVTGNDTIPVSIAPGPVDTLQGQFNENRWLQEKALSGIDFVATGNEPFWSLEISYDSIMIFRTANGDSIATPAVEGIRLQDVAATGYRAEVESGQLSIVIYDQKCIDDMSGFERPKKVEVMYKDQRYAGCGRFTEDYRLNDIWVLETINGTKMEAAQFSKGLPRFEFNTREGRLSGHAGCNNFNGTIEIQGRTISTGRFMSTRMACPNLETETALLSSITSKKIPYSIGDMKLRLQVSPDSLLVFKKVD